MVIDMACGCIDGLPVAVADPDGQITNGV